MVITAPAAYAIDTNRITNAPADAIAEKYSTYDNSDIYYLDLSNNENIAGDVNHY